jgi:hypothetical protein
MTDIVLGMHIQLHLYNIYIYDLYTNDYVYIYNMYIGFIWYISCISCTYSMLGAEPMAGASTEAQSGKECLVSRRSSCSA